MGDYFVDHFAGTREHELEVFRRAVTDWEGGSIFLFLSSCPPLRLLYTGFFGSWTSLSTSSHPPESRLSCSQSEYGDELMISPTIHRVDLGYASCNPKAKSDSQRSRG